MSVLNTLLVDLELLLRDIFNPFLPLSLQLPPTQLDATLDSTATDGAGHADFGSGNPITGWEIQNSSNFELASEVTYRQGNTAQPVSVNHDGSLNYNMPAGPQVIDAANGVNVANATHGATSFNYTFDTGVGAHPETIQQFLAHGGELNIKLDLNPGAGDTNLDLTAVYNPALNPSGSHIVWEASDGLVVPKGTVVIADDGGNAYATANSQNLAFYQSLIDTNPHQPGIQTGPISPAGTYDIETQIVGSNHVVIADIHSVMHLS